MKNFTSILLLSLIIFSCATIPEEKGTPSSPLQNPGNLNSVEKATAEFDGFMSVFSSKYSSGSRDIDSREWLMSQINFWADRDILSVQRIYEDLKYRGWTDDEKKTYLAKVLPSLLETRQKTLDDLSYLTGQSLVLRDMPWFVRDFFDERSEFSYWYLVYTARSMDSSWQQNTILPVMLRLIPEDRVTAVSYLWLKTPDSLSGMENEIYLAGYPWSRLINLLEISSFCREEAQRLLGSGEAAAFTGGSLF